MNIAKALSTTLFALICAQTGITQERTPVTTDPFKGIIERKTEENSSISVSPDKVTSLLPTQANLKGITKIATHLTGHPLSCLQYGSSANWKINVLQAGSYMLFAKISTVHGPKRVSCIFSIGNVSEQIHSVKTKGWEQYVGIPLLEANLSEGQQTLDVISHGHGLNILQVRIIPKKLIANLKDQSRFGMTKEELTLLWGDSEQSDTLLGKSMKGIKQEHERYFDKSAPAVDFYVGEAGLKVFFYKGRACAITISGGRTSKKLTTGEMKDIAESLCKVKFPEYPSNEKEDYAVYSTDMRQQYMLQYQKEKATIFHIPAWVHFLKENPESSQRAEQENSIQPAKSTGKSNVPSFEDTLKGL